MGKSREEIKNYFYDFIMRNYNKDMVEIKEDTLLVKILKGILEFEYNIADISMEIEKELRKKIEENIFLSSKKLRIFKSMTFGGFVDFTFSLDDLPEIPEEEYSEEENETVP